MDVKKNIVQNQTIVYLEAGYMTLRNKGKKRYEYNRNNN